MQILPATAEFLAHCRAASTSPPATWRRPSVNVAYGSYYLRYLLDHYGGNEMLARGGLQRRAGERRQLGGAGARAKAGELTVGEIPFPETRAYVQRVLAAQQRPTARRYAQRSSGHRVADAAARRAALRERATVSASAMPDFRSTPPSPRPPTSRRRSRRWPTGIERGRALPDAARRDRHRQDDDDGGRDRGGPAPDARDRPQQDARRAAVQRVPHVLPGQRGRVLRLLLRLLPARGLRPQPRPLHREGLGDQPGGRPPAPRRHRGGVRAPRRDRRGLGLLHLRPRLAGDL